MNSTKCRLCGGETQESFRRNLMQKMEAQYFSCPNCGYFQTETPFWLNEAYAIPINESDTGLIERNLIFAGFLSVFFRSHRSSRFLDFAGGYGILVRLMRNRGFQFFWSDAHCRNIFAKGFEWVPEDLGSNGKVAYVTAFEVLEHAVDPKQMVGEMLALGAEGMVFSTQLFRGNQPDSDWWYLGLEHGQHIGFFNRRSLEFLARHFDLKLVSFRGLHFFSKKGAPLIWFFFSILAAHVFMPRVLGVLFGRAPR